MRNQRGNGLHPKSEKKKCNLNHVTLTITEGTPFKVSPVVKMYLHLLVTHQ